MRGVWGATVSCVGSGELRLHGGRLMTSHSPPELGQEVGETRCLVEVGGMQTQAQVVLVQEEGMACEGPGEER